MAAVLFSVPILVPTRLMNVPDIAPDFDTQVEYQPLFLPSLPQLTEAGPSAKPKIGSGQEPRSVVDASDALPAADPPTPNRPKPDYAGAQEIVSNPPHSTKGVQTIRRPDLVAPPKLTYPLRLPSMAMFPAPAIPVPLASRLEHPVVPAPKEPSKFRADEPAVQNPVLPVDALKLPVVPAEPLAPKTIVTAEPSSEPRSRVLAATTAPEIAAPKALVVVDAVTVPPEPASTIPDAELISRFVVGPRTYTTASSATSRPDAKIAGAGASEDLPHPSVENGTGTRVEVGKGHAGVASTESPSSVKPRSKSGAGTAAPAAAGNKGLPGISISGGVPGRSGRAVATSPIPHGSYALTIISGGSSGGASRDLGVFSRSDTVYTVYIPMTDAGGGPDWPMQYTLMSSAPAQNGLLNGLLTPPVVLKKIQATTPKTDLTANSGPVFVTGIIDENGKLGALHSVRGPDGRTQSALNALAQWEFLAAHLDGKPVACKILIGVSVLPAEEVGK